MATACVLHVIACAVTRVSQLVRVCLCVSPPAPLQATASCCTASAACGEMLRAAQQQHQLWSRLGSWPAPGAHSKCILPWGCFLGLVHVYTCTWCHRVPPLLPRPRLPPFLSPPSLTHSLTHKLRWYAFQQQPGAVLASTCAAAPPSSLQPWCALLHLSPQPACNADVAFLLLRPLSCACVFLQARGGRAPHPAAARTPWLSPHRHRLCQPSL